MSATTITYDEIRSGVSFGERDETPSVFTSQEAFTLSSFDGGNRSFRRTARRKAPKQTQKTLRRFTGLLIELSRETARVCFVHQNEKILYDLPADNLRKAGIKYPNQPFEMDEVEMKMPDGGLFVGYTYKPLAGAEHAYIEPLKNDEQRKAKRDAVLKAFAKTQS